MKQALKLLIATLFLMLCLNFSYAQKEIYLSIDASNKLQITPTGTVELGNVFSRKVSWIATDPRIVSFQLKSKEFYPDAPWGNIAIPSHGRRLDLRVGFLYRFLSKTEWDYSITAYDGAHNAYPLDPKIAIKPGTTFAFVFIPVIALMILVFTSVRSLRRRKLRAV